MTSKPAGPGWHSDEALGTQPRSAESVADWKAEAGRRAAVIETLGNLADDLAEAMRSHEHWKDCDACILALDRYDEIREGAHR